MPVHEQLRLFDDPSRRTALGEEVGAGSLARRANGHAGAAKLLRDLVRTGLAEDALAPAAALVVALDAEAGER